MSDRRAVVIDNGSGFLKAGFAGRKEPSVVFPTVVGKRKPRCRGASLADTYTGEEAVLQRSNVTLLHPLERGVVNQWAEMEMVWDHAYQKLRANPEQQPLLVTENVLNPPANRLRTVETLLETYKVPGVMLVDTPSLCLHALGMSTGLVLESGYSATCAVPVVEGKVLREAASRLDLGGSDLTVFLLRLVESRGSFFTPAKRELFCDVKEKLCYVAMDYATEEEAVNDFAGRPQSSGIRQSYDLGGEPVTLETERFQCPESLFQPNWLRVDAMGVHQLVQAAIERCPRDVHEDLYANIVLTGGSTCFPGFPDRLEVEVGRLCPGGPSSVLVDAPDDRRTLAWKGGAMLAQSREAADKWITRQELHEVGESIVERKRGVFHQAGGDEDAPREGVSDDPPEVGHGGRTSSRLTHSTTPRNAMYRERKVLPASTATPTLFGNDIASQSPLAHVSSPGLRGGKLPRQTPTATSPTNQQNTPHPLEHSPRPLEHSPRPLEHSPRPLEHSPRPLEQSPANHHSPRPFDHSPSPARVAQLRKIVDETRPASPGVYPNAHFNPSLPQTPELKSPTGEDGLEPLFPPAGGEEPAFAFRRLSLFDNLLGEVTQFAPGATPDPGGDTYRSAEPMEETPRLEKIPLLEKMALEKQLVEKMMKEKPQLAKMVEDNPLLGKMLEQSPQLRKSVDENMEGRAEKTHEDTPNEKMAREKTLETVDETSEGKLSKDNSLLEKMAEDELLPGRGRSGLRRNETINVEVLKLSASSSSSRGRLHDSLTVQRLVPAIEITTCRTPRGSASTVVSEAAEMPPAVDVSPRKIKFNYRD